MKKFLFTLILIYFSLTSMAQIQFSEFYVEPNHVPGFRHEFFELVNPAANGVDNTDNYVLITYYERSATDKGVFVVDLPDFNMPPGSVFLSASANPFYYQDQNQPLPGSSYPDDFNWNSIPGVTAYKYPYNPTLYGGSNNGYAPVASPVTLTVAEQNDIFSRTKTGNDYVMFLFKDGVPLRVDGFIGGNNNTTLPAYLSNMPGLTIQYKVAPDLFAHTLVFDPTTVVDFENAVPSTSGTDNGYYDNCNSKGWEKSSAPKEQTPGIANGSGAGALQNIATSSICNDADNQIEFTFITDPGDPLPHAEDFPLIVRVYYDVDCGGQIDPNDIDAGDIVVYEHEYTLAQFNTLLNDGIDPDFIVSQAAFPGNPANPCYIVSLTPKSACRAGMNIAGSCAFVVTPVSLTNFDAQRSGSDVILDWQTASESHNKGFYLQRKLGGGEWMNITFIDSKAPDGNSTSNISYTFTDANPASGTSLYRLLQVDLDGKTQYSEVRSVLGLNRQGQILVYPSPSIDGILNVIFEDAGALRNVMITDMVGRVIKQWKGTNGSMQIQGLRSGLYNIRIQNLKTGINTVHRATVAH